MVIPAASIMLMDYVVAAIIDLEERRNLGTVNMINYMPLDCAINVMLHKIKE